MKVRFYYVFYNFLLFKINSNNLIIFYSRIERFKYSLIVIPIGVILWIMSYIGVVSIYMAIV